MFVCIDWYTVALHWIFRMEKKMRKMQCYTEYIQVCTQYKSVYTDTRLCIHWWNLYIWVYTHMSMYRIVYALMNGVCLRTSPYILVYTRMWHFAKTFMTFRFEQGISCILQGCSDHYATNVDTNGCIIWYMSAKLRFEVAHCLLADVGPGRFVRRWAGSTPAPAMMRGFAKRGFKFKPPGPTLPGCQWPMTKFFPFSDFFVFRLFEKT